MSEPRAPSARRTLLAWSLLATMSGIVSAAPPGASGKGGAGIYSCIGENGRRLTSDRPIPECIAREQRVLNSDGSVRRVLPPTLTAEERSLRDEEERRRAAEHRSLRDIIRRDRNLLQRYPDEPSHHKARATALDDVRKAVKASEARLVALAEERKPLMLETEFYPNRPLPPQLKAAIDANDASTEAQRNLVLFQQAEIDRINTSFDLELQRLRKLWAGAPPGSMGPLETLPSAVKVSR